MFVVEGVVLLILGLLALLVPPLATLGITIFLGWLFLVSGVMGLIATFRRAARPDSGGRWSRRCSASSWVLSCSSSPAGGAVSLTLVLIVFFIIEGVASMMYALDHRREPSGRWGLMLVSGLIDLVLAAIILAGLPGTAAWALGVLVGINMIFGGTALLAMVPPAREARCRRPNASVRI